MTISAILINIYAYVLSPLIMVAFAASLVFFFWGLAMYIRNAGDEKATAAGRRIMIMGVVGLFLASSFAGLTVFIQKVIGYDVDSMEPPTVSL